MSKKTNKFNVSINSIGTTEMNVEGNKELVRDIARMIINPIANHRVDLLENELLRTNAAKDSEISQLYKKVEELERSKSIQNIQLEQLAKTVELEEENYIKVSKNGISVKSDEIRATNRFKNNDVKATNEYRVTSGLNNSIEKNTDRIEKKISDLNDNNVKATDEFRVMLNEMLNDLEKKASELNDNNTKKADEFKLKANKTISDFNKAISNIQTALYKTGKDKIDKQEQQEDQKPKRKRAYKLKGSEQDYAYKESDGFNIGEMLNAYTVEKGEEVISHNNDKYTGIKVTDDGEEKYQCRYVCPNCEYKGKRFVFEHNNVAYCHKCNEKMKLYSVKSLTGQEKDIFNNYYAAGLYKPIMNDKRKEDE